MNVIPQVPPVGTGLDAVADIARRRAQGWAVFAQAFRPPDLGWVADLRSGVVRQHLEQAIGWREGELGDFGPSILMFGAFERSSRRRTVEGDLDRLAAAYDELSLIESFEEAGAVCELLERLAHDEAVGWSAGRLPRARELRLHQSQELRSDAGEIFVRVCADVVARKPRQPYLSLAQLAGLWAGRERAGSSFVGGP